MSVYKVSLMHCTKVDEIRSTIVCSPVTIAILERMVSVIVCIVN